MFRISAASSFKIAALITNIPLVCDAYSVKGDVCQVANSAGAYPGFCSMKRLGVFLLPLDKMLANHRDSVSISLAPAHLFT